MIIAGIDEAGLGPAFGPLTVSCCALRVPDKSDESSPWALLDKSVTRDKKRGDKRILVTDSKVVHGSRSCSGLERAALSFLGSSIEGCAFPFDRNTMLSAIRSNEALSSIDSYEWYRCCDWKLPHYVSQDELESDTDSMRKDMAENNVELSLFTGSVIFAGELNKRFDRGLNKSEAVMAEVAAHICSIASTHSEENISITVDKQGGRNAYMPFLMDIFPGAWIDINAEGADCSSYTVRRGTGRLDICFKPKADLNAFCVALASILSKYLRERFMDDFNSYFCSKVEGLKPTAGYHGDAPRFLDGIKPFIEHENIHMDLLLRKR
ncbi:MAG: hypothetical protein JXR97_14260 [Planctomycetes bacterium]|nr:hypothetical protein [Planctomycetota bacterium]